MINEGLVLLYVIAAAVIVWLCLLVFHSQSFHESSVRIICPLTVNHRWFRVSPRTASVNGLSILNQRN